MASPWVLAHLATQRGILENVKDDTGESEGPAEPAAPFVDEAVTRISRSNLILKRALIAALEQATASR
jgi:hypothetical protein